MQSNARTFQMSIEEYAVDHDGRYPPTDKAIATLTPGTYLILKDRLPNTPWGDVPTPVIPLTTSGAGLVRASAIAQGAAPTAVNTRLGFGRLPRAGEAIDATTYGVLLYDLDPKTGTYVIYGVGKKQKDAIVTAAVSNGAP